jgi:hypothetical protein
MRSNHPTMQQEYLHALMHLYALPTQPPKGPSGWWMYYALCIRTLGTAARACTGLAEHPMWNQPVVHQHTHVEHVVDSITTAGYSCSAVMVYTTHT